MHSFSQQFNNDHQPYSQDDHGDFYREHMGKATSGLSNEQNHGTPSSSDSLPFSSTLSILSSMADSHQPERPSSPNAMDTSEEGMTTASTSKTSPLSSPQHYQRRIAPGNVPLQGGRPISAPEPTRTIYSPTPIRPGVDIDRSSTLSLPVPMHDPYHTLPHVESSSQEEPSTSLTNSDPTPAPSSSTSRRPGYMVREDTLPRYDPSGIPFVSSKPSPSTSHPRRYSPASSFAMSDSESSYMPAPVPPTILTPPPPPAQDGRHFAPHEPFLARECPLSTEIRVETSRADYKLIVRLPGYRRDSM